nr:MAG TPA: hypothetical protein [Caudoviricetes sp.]
MAFRGGLSEQKSDPSLKRWYVAPLVSHPLKTHFCNPSLEKM